MPGNRASLIGRATAGVAFFFIVALLLPLDPISGFTLKKSGGKESLLPSEEIELFIQGKVSLLDNFSSDQLLFFADRIFEQEFSEGKRVLRERGEKDGEQYAFSFTKTISFLDEIIEKRGDDRFMDRFLYLRAYCYLEQGNLEKANRDFIEIAEKYNRSSLLPEVHFRLAEYYFSTEQIALALEAYEKVVEEKESPYYDKALYKIGWAYYLTSNFEKAIGYFTRLADLSYIPSKKDRVRNDRYEGEEGVLGSEDLSNEGLAYAAICYTNMGDAGQVLKTLSGKVKPYSSMLYGELAQAYFDQSKYEDFLLVFDEVLRRFKKVPVVLEMQKEIVTIQEISLSDKTAARTRKEKFVETFFPHMISKEMFLYREKLSRHLRPMIRELASYYHREAGTSGKKELFKKAGGYYEKYLELYEKARDVKKMTLYFAETLYESGRFSDAAKQFEKVASFDFDDLSVNEKALYGVVTSYEKVLQGWPEDTPTEEREKVVKSLVEAEKKYTFVFPKGEKSGPLFFRLGKRLFESEKYVEAIGFFSNARETLKKEREKNTALEYIADSFFNSGEFLRALSEYENLVQLARISGDQKSLAKAREFVALANVNIAKEHIKKGETALGAKRYERASHAFEKSEDKRRVLKKAMRLYISVRRWEEFDKLYSSFRIRFPGRERLRKLMLFAAKTAEENFDFSFSGKYFEMVSTFYREPAQELNMLLTSARQYEKGGRLKNAERIYSSLYRRPSISGQQELEFRYLAAELREKVGNKSGAETLYKEVVSLHRDRTNGQSSKGGGNRYFFGKASLKLLEEPLQKFMSMSLDPPFKKSFSRKLTKLGELITRLVEVTKLDITEFSTRSLYHMGALFENFKESVIESPAPGGLNKEEEEEYSFMLEEKAFPYEEKSIKAYEKSISIGRKKAVTDRYIDLSYDRLARISPAVYKRREDRFLSKVVPLPLSFGFIGKFETYKK